MEKYYSVAVVSGALSIAYENPGKVYPFNCRTLNRIRSPRFVASGR